MSLTLYLNYNHSTGLQYMYINNSSTDFYLLKAQYFRLGT